MSWDVRPRRLANSSWLKPRRLRLRRTRLPTWTSTWFGFFDESLILRTRSLARPFDVRDFDFFSDASDAIKHRALNPIRHSGTQVWALITTSPGHYQLELCHADYK